MQDLCREDGIPLRSVKEKKRSWQGGSKKLEVRAFIRGLSSALAEKSASSKKKFFWLPPCKSRNCVALPRIGTFIVDKRAAVQVVVDIEVDKKFFVLHAAPLDHKVFYRLVDGYAF